MKKRLPLITLLVVCLCLPKQVLVYPIDGYEESGIIRLLRLQGIMSGEINATKPVKGGQKSIEDIRLNLLGERGDSLVDFPAPDPSLQKALNALFPGMDVSYSFALLDITPGRKIRYAQRKEKNGYQPGSVGKLAVLGGLFCELQNLYPNDFEKRQALLKNKKVRGGSWVIYDEHEVPVYDPETGKFEKRVVKESDVFSLYEWADHMISVSNNSAASVVWRELILMREFGQDYPDLTEEQANTFFKSTPKSQLSDMAISIVNDPLRSLGITEDEWRLGTMFTRGAKAIVPGQGGSIGTPLGLMKFLVAMERGMIVDEPSSLEIKRLLYLTDKRIRYSAAAVLNDAAVYFKSGSLYSCKPEEGFVCKKYHGNISNYMNSIAIIEHPDSTTYMIAMMSNVLKKNSAGDHYALATQIDKIVRK